MVHLSNHPMRCLITLGIDVVIQTPGSTMNHSLHTNRGINIGLMTICFLSLFTLTPGVRAQSSSFVPARFGSDDQLAQMGVSSRDLGRDKNSISIRCQGFVETRGELSEFYCVPPNIYEDQKVTRAVIKALEDQTFNAAEIDGVPVRVLMNFTVSIQCAIDACSVMTVPHHGYHKEEFGEDYVAPQPVLPDNSWYTGFEDKVEWIDAWMPNLSRSLNQSLWPIRPVIAVEVDADGAASDGCIYFLGAAGDDREQTNRSRLEQAMGSIGDPGFIPGFHQGGPVTMRFFEHAVFRSIAAKTSRPRLFDPNGRISNRFYARQIANRTEAPDMYCAD